MVINVNGHRDHEDHRDQNQHNDYGPIILMVVCVVETEGES